MGNIELLWNTDALLSWGAGAPYTRLSLPFGAEFCKKIVAWNKLGRFFPFAAPGRTSVTIPALQNACQPAMSRFAQIARTTIVRRAAFLRISS
jgi:hypothetical protein